MEKDGVSSVSKGTTDYMGGAFVALEKRPRARRLWGFGAVEKEISVVKMQSRKIHG